MNNKYYNKNNFITLAKGIFSTRKLVQIEKEISWNKRIVSLNLWNLPSPRILLPLVCTLSNFHPTHRPRFRNAILPEENIYSRDVVAAITILNMHAYDQYINEILHCSISVPRQSFEIGVKAAREYRPISSNDFRFVIRGGQRFEARPRKGEKSNIEFPPNPLLTRESRWYRGYLDRTNQVSDLWKPRNSTAFAFLSPISFLLLHPSTIIIVEKSISTFLSTNHRVTKISTHSQVKERNLFPGCISQNYLREKEERSVENGRGKPWRIQKFMIHPLLAPFPNCNSISRS